MNAFVPHAVEMQGAREASGSHFEDVIRKLEKEILEGRKPDLCRQILSRDGLWRQADPVSQLKWARLAQMAGETDIALKVLARVTETYPDQKCAWEERLALIHLLGRSEELASVLERSRPFVGEAQWKDWVSAFGKKEAIPDEEAEAEAAPFERLKRRQEVLVRYMELFSGREDCFARQWAEKEQGKQGYAPVRRPMEPSDVEDHLSGRRTYGIYLVRFDGTVKVGVLDVDLKQEYRGRLKAEDRALVRRETAYIISRIRDLSAERGLKPLLEFSGGKGFHYWFLFMEPVAPDRVRRALGAIRDTLAGDLKAFGIEVFPKQERLSGKGFGNLVKLPLGVHRLTGRRSYFLACRDRSSEAQLEYLAQIEASGIEPLLRQVEAQKREKVLPHPRLQKWSEDFPELAALESKCPPLAQIIASCRHGKSISNGEERVLFQTVGFLRRAKTLLHHLLAFLPDYNPHLVDFKLSRVRGAPLGCRRIHSALGFSSDLCVFDRPGAYEQPLLHVQGTDWAEGEKSEKVENLSSAIDNLKTAILQVQRFLS